MICRARATSACSVGANLGMFEGGMHDRWDERRGRGRERGASADARRARAIALLERVARGLPIAVDSLVIGLPRAAARPATISRRRPRRIRGARSQTSSSARRSASIPRAAARSAVRSTGSIHSTPRWSRVTPVSRRADRWRDATFSYSPDGTTLSCSYDEHFCETSASCERTVYARTPSGLLARRSLASSPLTRWLADGAHLEAASVRAFEVLVAGLDAFGAPEPEPLVRAARSSADDETRHARSLRRLGAPVAPVTRTETGLRDHDSVAIDDAIEGCAREAYGALGAALQAQHARSHAVRDAYRANTADEARHALLSFRVNEWLQASLSSAARRRVEEAREQSVAALAASLAQETDATLRDVLGLPDATRGMEIVSALA